MLVTLDEVGDFVSPAESFKGTHPGPVRTHTS